MYNSMVVAFLVKVWTILVDGYKTSFLRKIIDRFTSFIKFLFKGSILLSFFVDKKPYLNNSYLYKVYKTFMDFIFRIIRKVNAFFKNIRANSLVSSSIDKNFETEFTIFKAFNVFILSFSIGLFLLSFLMDSIGSRAHKASILLAILAALGLVLGDKIISYSLDSRIYKWVVSIWTVDEGGDQWW